MFIFQIDLFLFLCKVNFGINKNLIENCNICLDNFKFNININVVKQFVIINFIYHEN